MPTKNLLILIIGMLAGCTSGDHQPYPADTIEDTVLYSQGTIFIDNQDISILAAPFDGKFISTHTKIGQNISKGRIIALIENSEILDLQKNYLDAAHELEFTSLEYARQGDLTVENATSMKRFEAAKHAYKEADLKYQGYRKQLIMLGFNPDSINSENISVRIPVVSTTKGIITEQPAQNGQYVKKGELLFKIARNQSVLIMLIIPEIKIWKIHKNQLIRFSSISDSTKIMEAFVLDTVQKIDPQTQTGEVIAKPVMESDRLLPGMSVKATIFLTDSVQ